jgi:hypothetical protein
VFFIQKYPDHLIFKDLVFLSPEFAAFAHYIQEVCQEAYKDSHAIAIQKAVPAVVEKLHSIAAQQLSIEKLEEIQHRELLGEIRLLKGQIDEFSSASWTVTVTPNRKHLTQYYKLPQKRRRIHKETPTPLPPQPPISSVPAAPAAPKQLEQPAPKQLEQPAPEQPSSYSFPRSIATIDQLLQL